MEVTLKEYFQIKGFARGDSTSFAEECGVSLSYISRLVHDHGEARVNTPAYNKVAKILAADGYELMLNPEADYLAKATKMENQELREKNLELTTSLAAANDKIANLERRIEIMNRVFKHIKIANTMLKELEENNMKKFITAGKQIEGKINKFNNITIRMDLDATEEAYLCFGGEAKYELSDKDVYDNDVIVAQYGNKFEVVDTGKLFGKLLKKISAALPEYEVVASDIEDIESEMHEGDVIKNLSDWEPSYNEHLYHGELTIKFFFAVKEL